MAFVRSLSLTCAFILAGAALVLAEDPVAALARRIEQGTAHLSFDGDHGYLPSLLEALHIPVESQIAVFSKTSIQALLIEPANPRTIYFNDSVSVGSVRGGFLELAAQDPGHGIRYYVLLQRANERLTRREDCVSCHKSGALQVRSVVSAADGIPSLEETDVDGRTPFSKLLGGWYVTGTTIPAGHMGNFAGRPIKPVLDAKAGLWPSSDIVALMVFHHQMRMMNLLAKPENIDELVDALLFRDSAPLAGHIRGDSGFAAKFSAVGPRDHLGRSLRDFDLRQRLMRYPCSYMIYSDAFNALPGDTKDAIYRRMGSILAGSSGSGGKAVIEILRETKPDLPEWFGRRP